MWSSQYARQARFTWVQSWLVALVLRCLAGWWRWWPAWRWRARIGVADTA